MDLLAAFNEDTGRHGSHAASTNNRNRSAMDSSSQYSSQSLQPNPLSPAQNGRNGVENSEQAPMFQLERVDYRPAAEILALEVASNQLIMGLANNHIIRLNLGKAEDLEDIEIAQRGLKEGVDTIRKVFLDPTGVHCLVAMSNLQTFYLHQSWLKPKLVPKMTGVEVTAVGWNKSEQDNAQTAAILVGTANGKIFTTQIEAGNDKAFKDRSIVGGGGRDQHEFKLLYTLDEEKIVSGLRLEKFRGNGGKLWIMASTPIRMYEFVGGPTLEDVFRMHEERVPRFHELPGDLPSSTVQFFTAKTRDRNRALPRSFAWMTEPGVYLSDLEFGTQTTGGSCVMNGAVVQYDAATADLRAQPLKPLALALTEFHFLVLFEEELMAVSTISHQVVWREVIAANTRFGPVRGLARDPIEQTLWLYTSWGVFEIPIKAEDRRVWELYLELNLFEEALAFAKTPEQKDRVRTAQADFFYDAGQFEVAAQHYGNSSRSFEEITLRFIQLSDRSALKVYLLSKLHFLKSKARSNTKAAEARGGDATQITLIATWLCELFLDELNHAQDEVGRIRGEMGGEISRDSTAPHHRPRASATSQAPKPQSAASEDQLNELTTSFHSFLSSFAKHLDKNTTFSLMTSHGRTESVLFFAKLKGDIDRVVQHLLQHDRFQEALEAIQSPIEGAQVGRDGAPTLDLELFYRYSPQLVKELPKQTIDAWIAAGPALMPARLIPALLRYEGKAQDAIPDVADDEAIRYLSYCVSRLGNTDAAIHNYLLSLFAKRPPGEARSHMEPGAAPASGPARHDVGAQREDRLLEFLKKEPHYYDNKYALRVCTEEERHRACVLIYNQMGLFEEATDLALLCGDLEEAEVQAKSCRDDNYGGLKKKLWLKIARFVVEQRGDIQQAMELLQRCEGLLKIEDILPFFPDFTRIDDFKKEICSSLEDYNQHIQQLKDEMEEATRAAEDIRNDVAKIREQYGFVSSTQRCDLCGYPVLTQVFYLFPCQHVVHVECQYGRVAPHLDGVQHRRVTEVQAALGLQLGENRHGRTQGDTTRAGEQQSAGSSSFAKKLSSYRSKLGGRGGAPTSASSSASAPNSAAAMAQQHAVAMDNLREELDDIVAAECTLCGDVMIDETSLPFINEERERAAIRSWSIGGDMLF